MSLLDFLSPALTTATGAASAAQGAQAGVANKQREEGLQQAMLQAKMLKDRHDQEIMDALRRAQTTKALTPAARTPLPVMKDGKRIYTSQNEALGQEAPAPDEPIVPVVQGGKPVYAPRSKAVGQEVPKTGPAEDRTLVQVQQPDGTVTYVPRPQAAGQQAPRAGIGGVGSAPMAAKVGQAGEMMKKLGDVFQATEGLDVGVGNSAARDLAEHGVHVPFIGTVPGTKGLGNTLMNRTPAYSAYQAALSPFILAAAHALSGARINQDQVEQIKRSIERQPGDNAQVRAQKDKNLIDLVNSIVGSLPPGAIGEQEGQLDEESLQKLIARGYRRSKGSAPQGGRGAAPPSYEDWLKAKKP